MGITVPFQGTARGIVTPSRSPCLLDRPYRAQPSRAAHPGRRPPGGGLARVYLRSALRAEKQLTPGSPRFRAAPSFARLRRAGIQRIDVGVTARRACTFLLHTQETAGQGPPYDRRPHFRVPRIWHCQEWQSQVSQRSSSIHALPGMAVAQGFAICG